MKKKNIITFIVIFVIMLGGLVSSGVPDFLAEGISDTKEYIKENGIFGGISRFTWRVETAFSEGLTYHKDFLDLNSAVQNNMGTAIMEKGDTTVIKSKTGYLAYLRNRIPDETLEKRAENLGNKSS